MDPRRDAPHLNPKRRSTLYRCSRTIVIVVLAVAAAGVAVLAAQ